MTIEFTPWPKTPRLKRNIVITEKIDGTNSAVGIKPLSEVDHIRAVDGGSVEFFVGDAPFVLWHDDEFVVYAQSRKRLIRPGADNFGFAAWVKASAEELVSALGPGLHFGEWWGHGIQRGYGLTQGDRRFSLFNTHRYGQIPFEEYGLPEVSTVPVLASWTFDSEVIDGALESLRRDGSYAVPGYMNPEGIIVFHSQSGQVYKILLENDELPKSAVERSAA